MSTFVSVGNAYEPFTRLIDAVTSIADALPQPVIIQHGHTRLENNRCRGVAFLDMASFEFAVREGDVLVLHAGAGSVIHALRAGKMPVIMPRRAKFGEHVDDHQVDFAYKLAEMGRVVVVEHATELEAAIERAQMLEATITRSDSPLVGEVAAILTETAIAIRKNRK